jgi:hypothetical protein
MIYITNGEKIRESLNNFPDRVHNKVLRKSVDAGLQVAATLMRPLLPRKTGTMFRSISTKVKLYNNACWGGVGPESSYSETHGKVKTQPSHIFHLMERGFFNKKANRYIPGHFIIPRIAGSPLIEGAVVEQMETEVEKIWEKG